MVAQHIQHLTCSAMKKEAVNTLVIFRKISQWRHVAYARLETYPSTPRAVNWVPSTDAHLASLPHMQLISEVPRVPNR
jgi:hypothetical protein